MNPILSEILNGSLSIILNLLKIIVPLMILIEFLLAFNLIEKLSKHLGFLTKILGISHKGIMPLMVGFVFGITYGAGVLKRINEEHPLSPKDLTLVSIFLFSCHGIIETTLILWGAGASFFFVFFVRILIAIIITFAFSKIIKENQSN